MTEHTCIIYLQQDKFDFYLPSLGKVIEFRFVPEIIKDLEVINVVLLENLIKLFIANNKITPTELVIVLSDNVCFIKDFVLPVAPPQLSQEQNEQVGGVVHTPRITADVLDDQIKHFIEHVPFENVVSKTFPMGNGTKVVAVNGELYESIKTAFEKSGFKINMVLPGVVFANNLSSKTLLDVPSAKIFLQESESLGDNNLLAKMPHMSEVKQNNENEISEKEKKPNKKSKKRLYAMLGVFAILIVIMIVVYITSLSQPA